MDLELTSEQKMIQSSVADFTRNECPEELFRKMDEEAYYPHDLYKKLADLGFFGISFPEAYGGGGMGCLESVIFQEALSKRLLPLQMVYQVSVVASGMAVLDLGTEAQKQAYLRGILEADMNFCIAYTEPGAGSDAAAISTSAAAEGDGYRINGQKTFISAPDISDRMIVSTRTDENVPKQDGITAFIVDTQSEGITINKINKLGIKAVSYCDIFFDDVYVPAENMIQGLNQGWPVVTHSLELDRIGAAARWLGVSHEALNYALEYAKKRVQFGRPIGKFQAIREIFADMQTELDAARLLAYRAALLFDQGKPCRREASMAKLYSSELVVRLTRNMMQILGGYSYAMEYHAQRYLRDCLFATIGAGTSQIQKMIIARDMGL